MNPKDFDPFTELLTTVSDYYGRKLAPGSIELYWNALTAFDFDVVKGLFSEHVRTSKFMPSIAELLDVLRTMDGRPNPEEAWAMVAKSITDEGVTIVWTEEMASAFGVAIGLQDDKVAARMAFREAYEHAVAEARKHGRPAKWTASLGHDPHGREGPLIDAAKKGRLTIEQVMRLLPYREITSDVVQLIEDANKRVNVATRRAA